MGHAQFAVPGVFTFAWPAGIPTVVVKLHGDGASGASSHWPQFGGAGGSGAYAEATMPRPPSGVSTIIIAPGGAALPAGAGRDGNPGGTTSFDDCSVHGAGGGQAAASYNTGGDGGTPGVCASGAALDLFWIPGGQGGASAPALGGINYSFPPGASAPMGGQGGNNGQGGQWPGGGGAPGNDVTPSGAGARGQIDIYW